MSQKPDRESSTNRQRRNILKIVGGTIPLGLAGCLSGENNSGGSGSGSGSGGGSGSGSGGGSGSGSGGGGGGGSGGDGGDGTDTITIGASLPLSGSLSISGQGTKQGYDLAAKHINEELGGVDLGGTTYKIEMKYYDSESNPERTPQLVQKLIQEDGIHLLMGPYGSGLSYPASSMVERYNATMMTVLGSSTRLYHDHPNGVFGIYPPGSIYGQTWVKYQNEVNSPKTVALLTENEESGLAARKNKYGSGIFPFLKSMEGLEVVVDAKVSTEAQDYTSTMKKCKDAGAELLMLNAHVGQVQRALLDSYSINYNPKGIWCKAGGFSSSDFYNSVGWKTTQVQQSTPFSVAFGGESLLFDTIENYAKLVKEEYDSTANILNACGAAGMEVAVNAMQTVGKPPTKDNYKKYRQTIESSETKTVVGRISYVTDKSEADYHQPKANFGVAGRVDDGSKYVAHVDKQANALDNKIKYPRSTWKELENEFA